MSNGAPWPRISLVTPSFNQGRYIEETIRSVLLQGYPNLEYVVIDAGSSDGTVAILKKYQAWLTCWVSEPDRGQSHAINKGFDRCSGDICNWLCSDDILLENALARVAEGMNMAEPCWLIGNADLADETSSRTAAMPAIGEFGVENFLRWGPLAIHQPSVFWNRAMQDQVGAIDESLHYCMDVDLWWRFHRVAPPRLTEWRLSRFRHHHAGKTTGYGSNYGSYRLELARWQLDNLFRSAEPRIRAALESSMVDVLRDLDGFSRIRKHAVLGRLLRLWKKLVNPGLPI